MADVVVKTESLVSVADAIRAKNGTTDTLNFPVGFSDAINALPSGGGSLKIQVVGDGASRNTLDLSQYIKDSTTPFILFYTECYNSNCNQQILVANYYTDKDRKGFPHSNTREATHASSSGINNLIAKPYGEKNTDFCNMPLSPKILLDETTLVLRYERADFEFGAQAVLVYAG